MAMLEQAKLSGATHAKIQNIYSWELTKREEFESPKSEIYRPYEAEFLRLSNLDLSEETERNFVNAALGLNLVPMTTVFTHDGAERARKAGFKSIKIASYHCACIPLIDSVVDFAYELVISTGGAEWQEIEKTSNHLKSRLFRNVTLLHATTAYPNQISNVNLGRMEILKEFGFAVGFSDHSDTRNKSEANLASMAALALGAETIERHFTILPQSLTKDGIVSLNPFEFAELAKFAMLKNPEESQIILENLPAPMIEGLRSPTLIPSLEEIRNKKYYMSRFASVHDGSYCHSHETCFHMI